jgi:hypothetical protein
MVFPKSNVSALPLSALECLKGHKTERKKTMFVPVSYIQRNPNPRPICRTMTGKSRCACCAAALRPSKIKQQYN